MSVKKSNLRVGSRCRPIDERGLLLGIGLFIEWLFSWVHRPCEFFVGETKPLAPRLVMGARLLVAAITANQL
jgi:hypothetical protein